MPKFGSVQFSVVFAWTANQNRTARRGCIGLQTRPAESGSNSVQTELNLQFFVDILSGKKECGEVLTSVCYAGKHVGPVKWGMPVWLLFPSWLLQYPFSELSILRIGTRSCLFLLPALVRSCLHTHTVIHLQLPTPSFGCAHTTLDCVEAVLVHGLHCHRTCSHYSWLYGLAPPLFVPTVVVCKQLVSV